MTISEKKKLIMSSYISFFATLRKKVDITFVLFIMSYRLNMSVFSYVNLTKGHCFLATYHDQKSRFHVCPTEYYLLVGSMELGVEDLAQTPERVCVWVWPGGGGGGGGEYG